LALLAIPAHADNLGVEIAAAGEAVVNKVELSVLGGMGDVAVGLYWPIVDSSRFGVTVGVLGALGNETALGGVGVTIPLDIDAPILNELDFIWMAREYNWTTHLQSWQEGVGKTFEVSF